ncbi:chromatin remodelling complex Rsc7/Swp82 subunit-domain-containing protein [Radiomyces spectabilis]|uniref:chromatin remodelling complex Rsc7/Swp82 subunit-domain-containing protein n=1 Tax=Radiomyces spectabilis TaxID=64574 RepID=UPI00221EB5F2|nr:chromatin remodelling complex Rsc7/Swp82 subunit-domain-containing protein [Radiomyces spectabilis]KAI8391349.1 chromatin remodelling complex Rsc7/Swp82 subunit-domain-containing protein [Radiomyces spectabilis]
MDPARVLGYRDSYLLFQRNPMLERVRIDEDEKQYLRDNGILLQYFRNRDVAVVTARSVFKCFGAKIIKKGKRCTDDYFEALAREEADVARRSLIAKTARSESYKTASPVTSATWMHHAALAVRSYNAQLHERRIDKASFYDVHTDIHQIPSATQPRTCTFQPNDETHDTSSTVAIEFQHRSQHRHGIGSDLLEGTYDVDKALDTLPSNIKEIAIAKLRRESSVGVSKEDQDDLYPLSLLDGQFQASFAVHFSRFNQPEPVPLPPSAAVAKAQSFYAQQYYLNQVYQLVNRNMANYLDPTRQFQFQRQSSPQYQASPPFAPPPNFYPSQSMVPASSPMPMNQSTVSSMAPSVCGYLTPKGLSCKRPVAHPGEKCQVHAPLVAAAAAAAKSHVKNKCADCHQLSVPEELTAKENAPICDVFTMIKCTKCTRKYHPLCANLTTPRQLAAVESYPWSCPECKICCVCKDAGDESTLMICDGCDRGWHTGCCNPKVDDVPEGAWLCPLCADCHGCDEQGSDVQYHHAVAPPSDRYKYPAYLATYCNRCYNNFTEDRFCTVCMKPYSDEDGADEEDNEMVACDTCDHWIHTRCDEILTPEKYQSLCDDEEAKYSCPLCSDNVKPLIQTSTAIMALKGLSAPSGYCVGMIGGKVETRGVVKYKSIKVGVPKINGTGIAEMPIL